MVIQKYSIGSVSSMVGLPQSVLRYWESQFDQLSPEKTPGGTRKYTDKDVAIILKIKDILYNKKFTIAGAKKTLEDSQSTRDSGHRELLVFIRNELESILRDLDDDL